MQKVAVSLAPADTQSCLEILESLAPHIELAEICLDLMPSFDLVHIIKQTFCKVIITCRPVREGGNFRGSETTRLSILQRAMQLGCAYIDVEWDSLQFLARPRHSQTQVIVSRHWLDLMPTTFWPYYKELRLQADVVKLVGFARRPVDILPVFDLLQRATTPVIGIAMGDVGRLTRLVAPSFASTLLTYAVPTAHRPTASGQLTLDEMELWYRRHQSEGQVTIYAHVGSEVQNSAFVVPAADNTSSEMEIHISTAVPEEKVASVSRELRERFPSLHMGTRGAIWQREIRAGAHL